MDGFPGSVHWPPERISFSAWAIPRHGGPVSGPVDKLGRGMRDLRISLTDRCNFRCRYCMPVEVFGPGWSINGSLKQRYRGNLNIRREALDGARLIGELRDIAFSLGSACASGSGRPSHVLRALGLSDREARSSIRLGFGRYTSEEELVDACRRIDAAARAQESFAA